MLDKIDSLTSGLKLEDLYEVIALLEENGTSKITNVKNEWLDAILKLIDLVSDDVKSASRDLADLIGTIGMDVLDGWSKSIDFDGLVQTIHRMKANASMSQYNELIEAGFDKSEAIQVLCAILSKPDRAINPR